MHGGGLDRLRRRLAGMLGGVGIHGKLVDARVAVVAVLLLQNLSEYGPATGRGPEIPVGRAVSFRYVGAAPDTLFQVLVQALAPTSTVTSPLESSFGSVRRWALYALSTSSAWTIRRCE